MRAALPYLFNLYVALYMHTASKLFTRLPWASGAAHMQEDCELCQYLIDDVEWSQSCRGSPLENNDMSAKQRS